MKTIILLLSIMVLSLPLYAMEIKFSDSTIPYIEEYKDLSVKNSFNNELTKILNTLQCNVKQRKKVTTFWENYTRIGYRNNDIVSIKIRSDYNCDGTHPHNDEDHSLTYDLENNRVVSLFDIFLKKDETYNFIRKKFYASIKDDSCKDKVNFYLESEKLFKEYLSFYLDKNEIVFKLKIPYGIRFCAKDIKIPYTELLNNTAYSGILKKLEKEFKKKKED